MPTPYLFFDGRAQEAIDFYPPASGEKVMHSCLTIGSGPVMISDGNCAGRPAFQGFSLSYDAKDEAEAKRRFEALAAGGQVQMPLGETFFARSFGIVADQFGVSWMIIAGAKQP